MIKKMKWLILIGIVFLLYAPVLDAPFLWDDEVMVLANPFIRSWDSIHYIFSSSAFGSSLSSSDFYRPIQILSYLINFQLYTNLSEYNFKKSHRNSIQQFGLFINKLSIIN